MLDYVRNIVSIMSNNLTRPIKLFHEAWESKKRYEKKNYLNGNHYIEKCVFTYCLTHYRLLQSVKGLYP